MLQNIAAATNSLPCLLCQQADQLISGASLDSDGMFRCYVRWPSHRISLHDQILKEYSVGSLHRYQEISGGGASHGRRSNSELLEQIPVGRGSVLLDEFDDEAAACPDASDLHRRGNRSQSGSSGCRVTLSSRGPPAMVPPSCRACA